MCEFKVFLDGKQVAEDVIYAIDDGGKVLVKNILGEAITFEGTEIIEVDVFSTSLILSRRR